MIRNGVEKIIRVKLLIISSKISLPEAFRLAVISTDVASQQCTGVTERKGVGKEVIQLIARQCTNPVLRCVVSQRPSRSRAVDTKKK